MRELAAEHIPNGVEIEWSGPANDRIVDTIQFHGGTFNIDHQLPSEVENVVLLRTVGVRGIVVACAAELDEGSVTRQVRGVGKAFGMEWRPNYPMPQSLVARLCMRNSILQCSDPVPIQDEPNTKCLTILKHLAEGNTWKETAAIMNNAADNLKYYLKTNYCPEFVSKQGINIAPLLLHTYGADLLVPEMVVRQQAGFYPNLPLTTSAFFASRAMRPLRNRSRQRPY